MFQDSGTKELQLQGVKELATIFLIKRSTFFTPAVQVNKQSTLQNHH
jgi:hypothetical protein